MNSKKRITLLIGLVCMAACVILSGCVGETTPTEPVQQTTAPVTEAPTQPVTEAPTEEPTEPTTEAPTAEPTEVPTEAPTEPSAGPSVNTGTGGGYTPVEPEPTEPEPTEPPVIEVAAPGSETNAYFENIPAHGAFSTVQIPAGESVHYVLKTPGTFLCIEDSELSVALDGQTADTEDGAYQLRLPADSTKTVRLMFTNQGSEAKQVSVQILDAPGSNTNPIALENLEFSADLAEGNASGMHYTWISDSNGELKLRLTEGAAGELTVTLGDTVVKLSETESDILKLPVSIGDQVSIQVTALPDDAGNYPAAQLQVAGYVAIYCDLDVEQIPYIAETVSIPAGKSVIYRITGAGGQIFSIPSTDASWKYQDSYYTDGVMLNWGETPAYVEIFSMASEDQVFPLEIVYSEGHLENPQVLDALGEIAVTVRPGMTGYYYSYKAETPGVVSFHIWEYPELEGKTDIVIENKTSQVTETLWTTDENGDPVEGYSVEVNVNTGDELLIGVITEKPEDQQVALAIYGDHFGSEENPIQIQYPGFAAHVPAGQTLYYCGYNMEDLRFTLTGDAVRVAHNGVEYSPNGGQITFDVVAAGRMPAVFAVTNTGTENAEYTVTLAYPLGHMENPDTLALGTNLVERQAGKFDYCLNFTAPRAGKLVLTFPEDSQWLYMVNNLTQYVYGDIQYSDSDPLMAVAEIAVNAGDLVQVRVNTYDSETPWETPAGTVSFDAAYFTGPTEITSLTVVTQTALISGETGIFTGEFYGLVLNVTGNNQTVVTYAGKEYTPSADGLIAVEFPESGSEKLSFSIYNGSSDDMSALIQFAKRDAGTAENPEKITGGAYTMVQNKVGGDSYYYSFTASRAGRLILTFETDQPAVYVINGKIYRYVPGSPTYQITMRANQTITIAVNTYDSANSAVAPKGIVNFTAKFY